MSVGHCGLICFADLFRDRIVLGSLARLATESGPENEKTCENCIRYVGFVPKSHVPFTRPATPPHPTHLRASCSLERRLRRSLSLSLSLSLSFSRTISLCERTYFYAVHIVLKRVSSLRIECMVT